MRLYTVHMRRPTLDPLTDVHLVKEGFSWPAFLFSFAWALACRLWLVAIALFAAELLVHGALAIADADTGTQIAVSLGFSLIVGLLGNDLKRFTLFRRGYLEVAIVSGSDIYAAERRFWDQRPQLAADLVQ